jgi:CheY-like chemotaxis protein
MVFLLVGDSIAAGMRSCTQNSAMDRRVLVVEDEDNIRSLMKTFLTRKGFAVATAIDGQEGIEQLSAAAFDVLVLDLMMPRVSGQGVLQFLDRTRPEMISHTVVATAYTGALPIEEMKRVCRVIRKPFELDELLLAIQSCAA